MIVVETKSVFEWIIDSVYFPNFQQKLADIWNGIMLSDRINNSENFTNAFKRQRLHDFHFLCTQSSFLSGESRTIQSSRHEKSGPGEFKCMNYFMSLYSKISCLRKCKSSMKTTSYLNSIQMVLFKMLMRQQSVCSFEII